MRTRILRIIIEEMKQCKDRDYIIEAKVKIVHEDAYSIVDPPDNSGMGLCPEGREFTDSSKRLLDGLHLGGYFVQFLTEGETRELKDSLATANREAHSHRRS